MSAVVQRLSKVHRQGYQNDTSKGHIKSRASKSLPVAHAEEVVPLEGVVGVGQHEEMLRAREFVPPHARIVLATVRSKVRAALSFDRICTARVALADAMENMKAKARARDLRSDTTTKTKGVETFPTI